MDLQLEGKTAIVTGSSRGLGLASARALAAEGCLVCMCARGKDVLEQAAADVPNSIAVAADLSTAEGAGTVVDAALAAFGRIDILINNVATAKHRHRRHTGGEWRTHLTRRVPGDSHVAARRSHMRTQGPGSIMIA